MPILKTVDLSDVAMHVVDEGTGPGLVLVHGFPLNHTMWDRQIDFFSSRCRVIAPDLRGFGRNAPASGVLSMEQIADDLAHLLEALDVRERVTFCGLSMGGYVGWQFWQRHHGRLGKLILCDTRAAADTPEARQGRLQTADRVLAEGSQVIADAMLPKLLAPANAAARPELAATLKTMMLDTSPATIAAALRGMADRADFEGMLPMIDLPTLVVCGEHDVISPPQEMRQIADRILSARYVELAAAGHMSPMEQPDAFNAAVAEFLEANNGSSR